MKKLQKNISVVLAALTIMIAPVAYGGKISVSDKIKNTINNHNNSQVRSYLIQHHGFSRNFTISNITLQNGIMKKVDQHIPAPSGKYQLMASTQYLNCGGLAAQREISLTKTKENSSTISTDNSFNAEVSVSAGVSVGEGPVSVEGSVSVSAGYNFNQNKTQSNSSSVEIGDTQSVSFPDKRGVWVFGLYAKVVKTEDLPFWIDFELTNNSILNITSKGKPTGHATFYQDPNYKWGHVALNTGTTINDIANWGKGIKDVNANWIVGILSNVKSIKLSGGAEKVCMAIDINLQRQICTDLRTNEPNLARHGVGTS